MSRTSSIPDRFRRQVQERARGCCEYCLIHESDRYYPHEPDHVIAEKHGGATSLENLAWVCLYCNRFKGSDLASIDPISHTVVLLFHPRTQQWHRHVRLNGARIEGMTASGRAIVALLHLNDSERVAYRLGLIEIGHYPVR
jgi:5-methylcytosine-specific restriction endonuclease McrA